MIEMNQRFEPFPTRGHWRRGGRGWQSAVCQNLVRNYGNYHRDGHYYLINSKNYFSGPATWKVTGINYPEIFFRSGNVFRHQISFYHLFNYYLSWAFYLISDWGTRKQSNQHWQEGGREAAAHNFRNYLKIKKKKKGLINSGNYLKN